MKIHWRKKTVWSFLSFSEGWNRHVPVFWDSEASNIVQFSCFWNKRWTISQVRVSTHKNIGYFLKSNSNRMNFNGHFLPSIRNLNTNSYFFDTRWLILWPRFPYHNFHAYSWPGLQRHSPGYPSPYYYNSSPYYRSWFHNYKEQWHHHWQKFRGENSKGVVDPEKFPSLFGKLHRCKSVCLLYDCWREFASRQAMACRSGVIEIHM